MGDGGPHYLPGPRAIVTSAVAYAATFLSTTVLHEGAHFVVAQDLGRFPVLYYSSVVSQESSSAAAVATSLAGPIASALIGVLFVAAERRAREGDPQLRLFLAWMGFHGLMNATGYLFTAIFAPGADVGSALRRLGLPTAGLVAASALGF